MMMRISGCLLLTSMIIQTEFGDNLEMEEMEQQEKSWLVPNMVVHL